METPHTLTAAEISRFCPAATPMAAAFVGACARFEINTLERIAAFFAQMAEESQGFTHLVENLNYSAVGLLKTWPRHFDEEDAQNYAHKPEQIANRAYANRDGNGDEASGDGWKYRGRGFPMLTGKSNYSRYGQELGMDLVGNPDLASIPTVAPYIGACYWYENGLNDYADSGNFVGITKVINGGEIGEATREAWLVKAQAVWPPQEAT